MTTMKNTIKLLGAAFLLQAVTSAASALLAPIDMLIVSGSIADNMTKIANNAMGLRASIVAEMITAMGVVMLGSLLYIVLRKQNRNIALVALGLYLIEAAILAASRMPAFLLLRVSQEYVQAGNPVALETLGMLFYEAQSFGNSLHMVAFGTGATLFYFLFYKAGTVPRPLIVFGLIAAPVALIGTVLALLGYHVPLYVYIPNLPFELGMGLWLLIRGINEGAETKNAHGGLGIAPQEHPA